MKKTMLLLLAATCFILLLSGCINAREEIWVFEDQSAQVMLTLETTESNFNLLQAQFPAFISPDTLLESAINDPNVQVSQQQYVENGNAYYVITISATSMQNLFPDGQRALGPILLTWTPLEDESYQLNQTITIGNLPIDLSQVSLVKPFLTGRNLEIVAHVPGVIESNGQKTGTADLIWKIPLASLLESNQTFTQTMTYSLKKDTSLFIPWQKIGLWSLIILGGIGLLTGIILLLIKIFKKPDPYMF